MANAAKLKGDRGEREAVLVLKALAPDLVLSNAQRKLGAGRREDTGDLVVFSDVTVQVKTYATAGSALRDAAEGAELQRARAGTRFALGMAPVPRARRGAVRWLASTLRWPGGELGQDDLFSVGLVSRAIAHVRRDDLGIRRERRVAIVERAGAHRIYVAPVEAWIAAWRLARNGRVQLTVPDPVEHLGRAS